MKKRKYFVRRFLIFVATIPLWAGSCGKEKHYDSEKNYLQLESKLKEIQECYLCGTSNKSMISYYRQFDTIGLIGLNEWYILDFGLGVDAIDSGTKTIRGNNQGVIYSITIMPSRGKSYMTVSTDEKFDKSVLENNLCQDCLNRANKILSEGTHFALIDFKTLELYSIPQKDTEYVIRDYGVKIDYEEKEIQLQVCYMKE